MHAPGKLSPGDFKAQGISLPLPVCCWCPSQFRLDTYSRCRCMHVHARTHRHTRVQACMTLICLATQTNPERAVPLPAPRETTPHTDFGLLLVPSPTGPCDPCPLLRKPSRDIAEPVQSQSGYEGMHLQGLA